MPRDIGVVLVAGGTGTRLGADVPKQLVAVAGVPMLLRSLRPFTSHPDVLRVAVVLPAGVMQGPPPWLSELAGESLQLVTGGAERMDSVERGLGSLPAACAIVLVHDAARPFVSRDVIDKVIARARAGDGAIAALPLSDTLKSQSGSGDLCVSATMPREGLWRAQTPQGFPRDLLERAYLMARKDGVTGTDEAALVERLGARIHLIADSARNLKVTTPDDLRLAELIAGQEP